MLKAAAPVQSKEDKRVERASAGGQSVPEKTAANPVVAVVPPSKKETTDRSPVGFLSERREERKQKSNSHAVFAIMTTPIYQAPANAFAALAVEDDED